MANGQAQMLNLGGNIPPEYLAEQQAINRQQQMAQLLMQQGMNQPSGQMVSGRYVAPSFFQHAAPLLQSFVGSRMQEKADKALASQYEKLAEEKKAESERLAKALRGQETVTEMAGPYGQGVGVEGANVPMPTATMQGKPDFRNAVETIMQNRLGTGRELLPALMQQAYPEPVKPTSDIQNYQFMKDSGQLPKGMTFLGYQTYLKQVGKEPERAPMGYRFTADGSLEPIKGGPADIKTQAKIAGAEDVDKVILDLRDKYDKLFAGGGITDPSLRVGSNLAASASSSPVGQYLGQRFGTQNQTYRNQIETTRPLLMSAIMKATGMSAKQIDSNAELKLWLSTATDPNKSYESNINALNNLENLFGTAALNKAGNVPQTNTPSAPQTNAPQAKPAEAGKPVYATNPNTKQRIVSTDGGITWKPAPKAQ